MKNALIIGVTGQDGAYLADFLLKKGYNVFGTFRRTSHRCFERLDEMNNYENIIKIKADVMDHPSIRSAFQQSEPDEVYNLAAMSHVKVSFEVPEYTGDIDGLGTLRLLESIRACGLKDKTRFYHKGA